MNTRTNHSSARGMTLLEVVSVATVLVILLLVFWPRRVGQPANAKRINCLSNLKGIGLSLRIWANDNGDKFPWQVPAATNGTLEFAESPEVFRHFLAASNELSSPKVLTCASDDKVTRESDFAKLNNSNLSYFVDLDSKEGFSQTILSGDRNILGGKFATNRIFRFDAQSPAGWSQDLHNRQGNIGLGDGSAMQVIETSLRKQIQVATSLPEQIQVALVVTNVTALRFSIPQPN